MPSTQRTRDAALILPLIGAFLLMSPTALVFDLVETVFGIPMVVLYIFGTWFGLILIALALARRLSARDERRQADERLPEEALD
jgi:hypothetical protein